MPISIEIKPFGFAEAATELYELITKAEDLSVPLEATGIYLVGQTHRHFREERSPENEPWQSLTDEYVARRGSANPILYVTGELEDSIEYKVDKDSVALGSNATFPGGASRAAIHQLGGEAGHGAYIPARPFLGVNEEDAERIVDLFKEYFGVA